MHPLNLRARKILSAVVSEYLATGDAVGSRTVTRRHGVELSPATVRNVMADLEEAGLLKQPHTSAGRVPTEQGLRFFVDSLLKVRSLGPRERDELRARYHLASGEQLDGAVREASKVLSELAGQMVVLSTPRHGHDVLEHIEFMRLASGAMLAVLITKSGHVENRIVVPESPIAHDELERIHNYLDANLGGRPLAELRARIAAELASDRVAYDELARKALTLSQLALPRDDAQEILVEGQGRLLEQAMANENDVGKLKQLLHALEEKQHLVQILEKTEQADGLQVFIGAEAGLGEVRDLSVVAVSYGPEDQPLGTLGVIGPTRMNYSRVIALVDFTAQLLSNVLRETL